MFPRTPQLRHAKFIIVMCDDFKNNLFQPARFHLFKTYASQALKHKSDKQPNNHLVKSETYRLVTFYILLCSF